MTGSDRLKRDYPRLTERFPCVLAWPDVYRVERSTWGDEHERCIHAEKFAVTEDRLGDYMELDYGSRSWTPRIHIPQAEPHQFIEQPEPRYVEQHRNRLLNAIGVSNRHRRSLDELETSQAIEQAREWVARWETATPPTRGLLLVGGTGTGKTQLLSSICWHLCGWQTRYWTTSRLIADLKDFDGKAKGTEEDFVRCDVAVLDDLGAEGATDWTRTTLTDLIDQRYQAEKLVLVATNLNRKALEKTEGERLVSRLWEMCTVVPVTGSDRRAG